MPDENYGDFGNQGDSIAEEDKTSKNDTANLDDIPDEDESLEQEDERKSKEESKVDRSEIAQKIKYREKFLKEQGKTKALVKQLEENKSKGLPTETEQKELAAQKYIRDQARKEFKNIQVEEEAKEEAAVEEFENQIDKTLNANPDLKESDLLKVCEEYEVEPDIAAKILNKVQENQKKKPSLPVSKRGSADIGGGDKKIDDSKKSLFDIAQDVKKGIKKSLRQS